MARMAPLSDAPDQPHWPLALWSILGFWTIYFVLASTNAAIAQMPAQGAMMVRRLCVSLIAIGLTFLLYLLLHRFQHLSTRRLLALAFAGAVPLAFAYATVNYVAFHQFPISEHANLYALKPDKPMSPPAIIISTAIEWYFFIASWAVMAVTFITSERAREAERRAAQFAQAATDAELRALRYQVNPHFLFNTLNSLSALVMNGRADEAERMILNLSTFFRESLTRDARDDIPLAEEIRLQQLYLDIEAVRFPSRLIVRIEVPPALSDVRVPALLLQPLVENAIKYGVSQNRRPVTVRIAAEAIGDRLSILVHDDGAPASSGAIGGCGVGLANVRARLAARHGEQGRLTAGPAASGGWAVQLSMPIARAASAD